MQAVIEDLQGLENVPPILAFIIETLIEHVYYVVELGGSIKSSVVMYVRQSRGAAGTATYEL